MRDERELELIREDEETRLRVYRVGSGYHVVSYSIFDIRVYSVVPNDMPDSGAWTGGISTYGVTYVSTPRTRANAMRWFRKLRDDRR